MGLGDFGFVACGTAALGLMPRGRYATSGFVACGELWAAIDNAGSVYSPAPTSPVDPGGGVDHAMVE